ncbi:retropepsin-like domain-containing protein [Kribbella sp. NBC_01505]|uniref:retropepsin-like aspartic protease n=1 Tax=Kribbella sp. NBC_01505 TaxID=2903580 RepID=UPI00386C6429
MIEIPFDRVGHLIRIAAGLPGGQPARFLVDTGIGISLVHPTVVDRAGLQLTGEEFTGRRMSGQEVRTPLTALPVLRIGDHTVTEAVVAVAALGAVDGADGFDGILGLDLLGELPLTVDPFTQVIRLGVPAADERTAVPVRVRRDGRSVELRAELRLPDGQVVEVEIDTGSGATILDSRFLEACSVELAADGVRTVEGVDETGHRFVRRFAQIAGALSLDAAPDRSRHEQPTVMFQDLGLDGLIGTQFLDRFVQTYDTGNATLSL